MVAGISLIWIDSDHSFPAQIDHSDRWRADRCLETRIPPKAWMVKCRVYSTAVPAVRTQFLQAMEWSHKLCCRVENSPGSRQDIPPSMRGETHSANLLQQLGFRRRMV